jgi:hypothetical protein
MPACPGRPRVPASGLRALFPASRPSRSAYVRVAAASRQPLFGWLSAVSLNFMHDISH